MTGWTLRVVWPICDPLLGDTEAMAEAWFRLGPFVEAYQITLAGQPHMKVILCTAEQQRRLRARRAVLCEAAAIPRSMQKAQPLIKEAS